MIDEEGARPATTSMSRAASPICGPVAPPSTSRWRPGRRPETGLVGGDVTGGERFQLEDRHPLPGSHPALAVEGVQTVGGGQLIGGPRRPPGRVDGPPGTPMDRPGATTRDPGVPADPERSGPAAGLGPGRNWGWASATVLSPMTPPMAPARAAGTCGLAVSARATRPPGRRASTSGTPKVCSIRATVPVTRIRRPSGDGAATRRPADTSHARAADSVDLLGPKVPRRTAPGPDSGRTGGNPGWPPPGRRPPGRPGRGARWSRRR